MNQDDGARTAPNGADGTADVTGGGDGPRGTDDTDALRAENERLRAEVRRARAQAALREALLARGALPETCGLLAAAVPAESLETDASGALRDPDAVTESLRSRYGLLFRRTEEIPAPALRPPRAAAPGLTRDDLRRMSAEEINAQWSAVRDALRAR